MDPCRPPRTESTLGSSARELTTMPTIRIATDCTLPPARVLHAAYDFGPDRALV
jgi:hypothetical protein